MSTGKLRRQLNKADPVRWPLQIQQVAGGWIVSCYNKDGHARHIASAESEMQAMRTALNMARVYHLDHKVLVSTDDDVVVKDLDKLGRLTR